MAALGRRHGGTEGVSAWVTKPIRRQHLRDSLERALGRLPMGKIAGDGPPAAGDAAVAVAPAHARILLAEDNEVNQKVALAILGKLGYHADLATNGREALAALLTNRYDLVLMDCHMPDMDGYEASRAIRRQAAPLCQVPIVALTANAMEGDEGRCREAGMDGYVAKPVTRRALSAALERWLSAR